MPIEFDCHSCDRHIRVRDDLAGKRVKCPDCAEALTVPEPAEPEPERPASRIRADRPERALPSRLRQEKPDEDEDDDRRQEEQDDEDEPRPKRRKPVKKSGSGLRLALILGGGALGTGLLALGLWLLLGRSSGGGDLARWVPGDAQGFATFRAGAMFKAETARALMDLGRKAQPGMPDPAQEMHGLTPDDIVRATIVVMDAESQTMWFILEASRPLDQDLARTGVSRVTEANVDGKKYFLGVPKGQILNLAYHFPNDRMVVYGPEPGVRRAIGLAAKERTKGPLDASLGLLSSSRIGAGALILTPRMAGELRQALRNPQAAKFAALGEFTSATMALDMDKSFEGEVELIYASDTAATAAKNSADEGLKALKGIVPLARLNPGMPRQLGPYLDFSEKFMDSLKAELRGTRLVLTFKAEGAADAIRRMEPIVPPIR